MQKEKKIKTYQRRTKSGKMVTVKAHTAKYDAAEKAKEMAKKKGAGDELDYRKKMPDPKLSMNEYLDELKKRSKEMTEEAKEKVAEKEAPKKATKKSTTKETKKEPKKETKKVAKETKSTEPAFTAAEFKEWYRGTGSAADKKVAKALRAQLGRSGYRKLEDEAIDNYSSRGHLSMFKRVSGGGDVKEAKGAPKAEPKRVTKVEKSPAEAKVPKTKDSTKGEDKHFSTVKELHKATKLDRFENGASLTGKQYLEATKLLKDSGYRQVKDYLVPPKGKGPLYSVWNKKLSQAGYDDERDLYTGHDILSKSQREIMGSLGYTAFKAKTTKTGRPSSYEDDDVGSAPSVGKKRKGTKGADIRAKERAAFEAKLRAFKKLPIPAKGTNAYAVHMAVRTQAGKGGDDSCSDALKRYGYKGNTYKQGIKEMTKLAEKHGIDW